MNFACKALNYFVFFCFLFFLIHHELQDYNADPEL